MLRVVESKVQTCWMKKRKKGLKRNGEKYAESSVPVRVGTLVTLSDGNRYEVGGKVYEGPGTRYRYNFKAKTWSIQSPDTLKLNAIGVVETGPTGEPTWVAGSKRTGMTDDVFKRTVSPKLLPMIRAGHEAALAAEAAEKASRMAA